MKQSIKKKNRQTRRKDNMQDGTQIKAFWLNAEEVKKYEALKAYFGVSKFSELYRVLSTKEYREIIGKEELKQA